MDRKEYIKNAFEAYYARYNQVTEEGFCRWMRPDVPDVMKVADIDEESTSFLSKGSMSHSIVLRICTIPCFAG
ncbi:hypothetical protein [Brevibacillus brevis]|uniref:hypothetical protein n=1 Tax=Brevibacillus brevis TaxID=1393 RepID=UPI002ED5351E